MIERLTGRPSELEFAPPRTGELGRSALSSELAARDLGWHPTTPLVDGVQAVISWIKAEARPTVLCQKLDFRDALILASLMKFQIFAPSAIAA